MSTRTTTIIEMLGKMPILPPLKDEANVNISMYQNYTNVEKAILLYLARRGKLGSSVTIKSVDKLRNKYELHDLEDAWENLKNHAIVRGNLGGGNINGPEVLKLVKDKYKLSTEHDQARPNWSMTAEKDPGHLEPKPPEILQKLKWLRLYGWSHRKVVVAAVGVVSLFWFINVVCASRDQVEVVMQSEEDSTSTERESEQEPSLQLRPTDDAPLQESAAIEEDPAHPTEKTLVLTTGESPDEILEGLSHLDRLRRDERAEELYEGRWIPEPGWVGVVFGLSSRVGQDWVFTIKYARADGTESMNLTHLYTKQDAASLRPGVRVRVTGKVREVSTLAVSLEEVSFEVVNE